MNILEFQGILARRTKTHGADLSDLGLVSGLTTGLVVDTGAVHSVLNESAASKDDGMALLVASLASLIGQTVLATHVLEQNRVPVARDETLAHLRRGEECGHLACAASEVLTRVTTIRVLVLNNNHPTAHAHLVALTGALLNIVQELLGTDPGEFLSIAAKTMKVKN